jgi:hypothetical protein
MTHRRFHHGRAALVLTALLAAGSAGAHDKWDLPSSTDCADDEAATCTELSHGTRQTHDLEGLSSAPDQDWMVVETKAGRSYEVRVSSANLALATSTCTGCVVVDRVDSAGVVLTAGEAPNGGGPANGGLTANSQVVRWVAGSADQRDWIRVIGDLAFNLSANDQYDVELLDTTYFVPRWNQSGTQSTVFLIQNASQAAVNGSILFYSAAGALQHTQPFSVPRNGLQVFGAGSVPALAGGSGSAAIVHTGGYGALSGKAVALEPATGFTFDTPLNAVPR